MRSCNGNFRCWLSSALMLQHVKVTLLGREEVRIMAEMCKQRAAFFLFKHAMSKVTFYLLSKLVLFSTFLTSLSSR